MTQIIKAIPTEYNGEKFKSRLEARWAVFFELIGFEVRYENSEWCNSEGLKYTPDFEILWGIRPNSTNHRPAIEIKPTTPNQSYIDKIMKVRDPLLSDLFICVGDPSFWQPTGYWIKTRVVFENHVFVRKENVAQQGFYFKQCSCCKKYNAAPIYEIDGIFYEEDLSHCSNCWFPEPKDWKQAAIDCKHFRFDL